jgi:DNA-binding response OmpR family regulator
MKLFGGWLNNKPNTTDKPEGPAFAANNSQTPEAAVADGPSIGEGRKILIVDDNKVVLKAFELKLKTLGFQVLTAAEGSAAVSIARQEKPDLVVLDVNFPPDVGSTGLQWDGFNIMEWMSRFKEVANIPVIVITSGDPVKFKPRAMAAGAVAFFQKPINHEEFLVTVRRILGHNKSSNPAAA